METNPVGKYAWTAKVGEKGQIVIPKEAREVFAIKPEIPYSCWGIPKEASPSSKTTRL